MSITTRDALLALRQYLKEDEESKAIIADLAGRLSDALSARSSRIEDMFSTMEAYVEAQSAAHGFDQSKPPVVKAAKKTAKKRSPSKKKKKKKRTKKRASKKRSTTAARPGWQGKIDKDTELSEKEQELINLLRDRWPLFTSTDLLVEREIVPHKTHVSPKITQLRRKGVPIESARQARTNDPLVSMSESGYRLIG